MWKMNLEHLVIYKKKATIQEDLGANVKKQALLWQAVFNLV
jgi:hypothetical protein